MSPWRINGSQTRALPSRHVESILCQEGKHQLSTQTCHPPFSGTKLLITAKHIFSFICASLLTLRPLLMASTTPESFWPTFHSSWRPLTEQTTVKQEVFIYSHQVKNGGFGALISKHTHHIHSLTTRLLFSRKSPKTPEDYQESSLPCFWIFNYMFSYERSSS